MVRTVFSKAPAREALWFVPLLCIVLMAAGLLRPLPLIPPLAGPSRTVPDAFGTPVRLAIPFRGTVLPDGGADWYLENTLAPETLLEGGDSQERTRFSKSVVSWVYPDVLKNNWIWSVPSFRQAHGENIEIESQLAQNAGAYVGCCGAGTPLPMLRRFGLPVVYMWKPHKGDEIYFMAARTSAAVAGYPERGESLIARYRKSFADLDKELQPATLAHRPRVLVLSSKRADGRFLHPIGTRSIYDEAYFPRAGVVNALVGHDHSAGWDAERILAVDPGIIFVTVETPEEFLHDPRWQGLRAVAEKRVYSALGTMSRGPITTPVFVRQIAEIAHPERLLPRVRQLLRERFQSEFDYPLREDQIDYLLHIDANRESKGFDRFMREGQPAAPEGTTK